MALPDPPPNVPRIVEVEDPAAGQYVVMVRMSPELAAKYPKKPWGTAIESIGLAKKDSDLYPNYVLVGVQAMKGAPDLLWVFQKLNGPTWTTKTKGVENITPAKYRRLITQLRTEQEVSPDTEPDTPAGALTNSVVEQQKNTGKAFKVNTTETITTGASALTGERFAPDGTLLATSENLVTDGTSSDRGLNVAESVVDPIGNGSSVKQTVSAKRRTSSNTTEDGWPKKQKKSKGVENLTPQKFRGQVTTATTTEQVTLAAADVNEIPDPASPTGSQTVIEHEKVNDYRYEKRTTTEVIAENSDPLVGSVLLPDGQVGTSTETLIDTGGVADVLSPNALHVDGSIDPLGNGKSVKKVVTAPAVFDGKSVSVSKPDVIPAKFQAAVQSTSTEETLIGDSANPVLDDDEESRSEQRIDSFKIRRSVKKKAVTALPVTLDLGKQVDGDGVVSSVVETLATGAQTVTPSATVSGQVEDIGNGMTVKTELTKAEVFAATTYSKEVPDTVPQRFRVAAPTSTTQTTVEGAAEMPTLGTGELAKSEQQATKFTKRTSTTSRAATALPVTLTQKATSNSGLVSTITETLQTGDTAIAPTATKTVESEAIGDGTYVVRTTETPVFSENTFSAEKPEIVPTAFRAAVPEISTSEVVSGTAEQPTLAIGDKSASQQQVNAFLKKTSRTSRDLGALPVSLTETTVDQDGVVGTVVKTLSDDAQTVVPSATVSGQVEELGDGLSLKTEITKTEVFAQESYSKEVPDPVPPKFRLAAPTTTTEVTSAGNASAVITLAPGEIAKSESQQTKFTKRTRTTSRSGATLPISLTQKSTTNDGQLATVTETLQATDATEAPSATLSIESDAVGDGTYVVRKTQLDGVLAQPSISVSRSDLTPAKFQAATVETTTESTVTGDAEAPILDAGEFSASQQQVTKFTKRVRKTSRDVTTSATLTSQVLTNDGQVGTKVETLASGAQDITGSATTVDASVDALGDGRTVKTVITVPEVFANTAYSTELEDTVPAKFRAGNTRTTTAVTAAGAASPQSLGDLDLSKSEQQVNAHVKRTTTTSQEAPITDTLAGSEVGEVVPFVTEETLVDAGTDSDSGITIIASTVEPIGDGRAVKRTKKVASWPAEVEQESGKEVPDLIPGKFRKSVVTGKVTSKVAAIPLTVTLGEGERAKTYKKETPHRVEQTTITETIDPNITPLAGEQMSSNGTLASTTEALVDEGTAATKGANVISSVVEPLGNGKAVSQTVSAKKRNSSNVIEDGWSVGQTKKKGANPAPEQYLSSSEIRETTTQEELAAGNVSNVPAPSAFVGSQISIEHQKVNDYRYEKKVVEHEFSVDSTPQGVQVDYKPYVKIVSTTIPSLTSSTPTTGSGASRLVWKGGIKAIYENTTEEATAVEDQKSIETQPQSWGKLVETTDYSTNPTPTMEGGSSQLVFSNGTVKVYEVSSFEATPAGVGATQDVDPQQWGSITWKGRYELSGSSADGDKSRQVWNRGTTKIFLNETSTVDVSGSTHDSDPKEWGTLTWTGEYAGGPISTPGSRSRQVYRLGNNTVFLNETPSISVRTDEFVSSRVEKPLLIEEQKTSYSQTKKTGANIVSRVVFSLGNFTVYESTETVTTPNATVTYYTAVNAHKPSVLTNILIQSVGRKDNSEGPVRDKVAARAVIEEGYTGLFPAKIEETFVKTAPAEGDFLPLEMVPQPIVYDGLNYSIAISETLHNEIVFIDTIGSNDPDYEPNQQLDLGFRTFASTIPSTIPSGWQNHALQVEPYLDGYLVKKISVKYKP